MPTFTTPDPVRVTLELGAGDARITASEDDQTVVDVAPRDPARRADVRAAEQTRVDFADGRLVVRTPRQPWTRGWTVDVTLAIPAGSRLDGHTGAGALDAAAPLADCTFKSGAGSIRLRSAGAVRLASGAGDISVECADGDVAVTTGAGAVRIDRAARAAVVKTGNGTTEVGSAGGDLRVTSSNGDITIGRVEGSLVAKTANGSLRVGEVGRGPVELSTAYGQIEVGIAAETAARLDVRTHFGNIVRELDAADAPPASARTVEIRGRTGYGDITIRRATA
jgi:hypothetical protein